jgi:nucleotide-binding universal stress UspA family protein
VVVGVDGSPVSEAALAFAFAAADGAGADLVAQPVWTDSAVDPQTVPGYQLGPVFDWGAVAAGAGAAGRAVGGMGAKYPDFRVERVVTRERAARALVERSGRARLLVVGSHGRDSAGSAVWSVSHAVLQRARCPVAVVRPETQVGKP